MCDMDHHGTNGDSSAGNSPPTHKRQRAKQACEPCRLRKRRCDGALPCNMCTQFEYKCYFEKHPRKRSKIVEAQQPADLESPYPMSRIKESICGNEQDASKMRSMEANSGIAFTRLLGMRLDPSSGPKLFTFGWNLGVCTPTASKTSPITDILSYDQMHSMGTLYFEHVHPLYGILDKEWTLRQIVLRWSNPDATTVPDHLLCGIAALGNLFAEGVLNAVMPQIVNAAKCQLENSSTMVPPSLHDVTSWVLRCLYLRATDHPHACWMATSITMHLVEAIGLQQEQSSLVMHPPHNDHAHDPEVRRRTFWVARMLNSWVSFEYGRTRVALRGITCKLPTPREGDFTTDYVDLYGLSCCLDPERDGEPGQWEYFLKQIEAYEARHDGVMLSRANLALCAYRRLRLANPILSAETTNRIIAIGLKGLEAARSLASKGLPWWHVANVPFQVTCVFLAMDVKESLLHISSSMRTLEYVVERFNTKAMKEALKTARFLIRLSKKRKEEDSEILDRSLKKGAPEPDPQPQILQSLKTEPIAMNGSLTATPGTLHMEGPLTTSSGEDWNLDYLNNSEFDWNFFLSQEMPAMNGFAPDGTM